RNLEQYLAKKAQDMLEKVLGPGQAIVRVSAEINFDTITRTEEKYDPEGQVIRTQTKNDENLDSTMSSSGGGPAGISANTATDTNSTQSASSPVNNTRNRKTVSTVEYDVGKSTSSTMQAAGGIKKLSAAVTVAARMEGQGADRKVTPRSAEELVKLRHVVESAIGIDSTPQSTRGDQITLEELPFNDQFAAGVTQELDQQQKHQAWWDMARNAVYPVLALGALIVLVVIFKRTPIQEIPLGVPVGRLVGNKGSAAGNGDWSRGAQPGVVSVEVLNRLVKENPTNMTQALREWLNKSRSQS
ncbi:MAG TPA: flagellar M-ring protein FliF C-terminal domain-containing protein, partial [Verrucomicrobiae bacterium]|nr:flagellar M-ring protein FliF C-terminal domain-containing protein [Verrucomicrobiae bacterium]